MMNNNAVQHGISKMRAEVINPNDMTTNKQYSKTESTSIETPHFAYTLPLAEILKRQ